MAADLDAKIAQRKANIKHWGNLRNRELRLLRRLEEDQRSAAEQDQRRALASREEGKGHG